MSPQKFSAKYHSSDEDVSADYQDENQGELEGDIDVRIASDFEQYDTITPAAPLPPLYQPTVPPTATASHQQQQQSVRYVDPNGNYISDQDISQFVQNLRKQLLQNLITILSSALQANNAVV